MKLSDKARELNLSSRELSARLKNAGYDFKSPNALLTSEALQFLELEADLLNDIELLNAVEQAVIIPTEKGTFQLVTFLINPDLEIKVLTRRDFDSKVRAYYELNYLVSRYEQGR